jgi:tryptophanyl-tRNA synthetase
MAPVEEKNPVIYPPRVVSGIQPTPVIHIGHYYGALKQHIELHHEYPGQTFVLIADYHSLTRQDSEVVRNGTMEIATTYLALGLDPDKAVLYRQSDIPEVTELAWILSCQVRIDELKKIADFDKTVGLFVYPALMAADILALLGTVVPRAIDQGSNIELTREVAKVFNEKYEQDFFPLPENRVNMVGSFVPGTDGEKMHTEHHNTIGVFERFDSLRTKIAGLKTTGKKPEESRNPGDFTLFKLLALVAPERGLVLGKKYFDGEIGYGEAERELVNALQEQFGPYEEKYHQLKNDPDFVRDVLRENVRKVRGIARDTVDEVRKLVGLSLYGDDE